MYDFMTQGLGMGPMNVYGQDGGPSYGPGAGVYGSAGFTSQNMPGTAIGLLAIVGGLVVLYVTTRSIQGSR